MISTGRHRQVEEMFLISIIQLKWYKPTYVFSCMFNYGNYPNYQLKQKIVHVAV